MPKYHGKGGVAYLAPTGVAAATLVVNLTQWSLSLETETTEVTSLGDEWKTFVRGVKGGTGQLQGYFADDADVPFDAFDDGRRVACYLYPSSQAPGRYWSGYVWPTGTQVETAVNDAVRFTLPFTFDGVVTRVG